MFKRNLFLIFLSFALNANAGLKEDLNAIGFDVGSYYLVGGNDYFQCASRMIIRNSDFLYSDYGLNLSYNISFSDRVFAYVENWPTINGLPFSQINDAGQSVSYTATSVNNAGSVSLRRLKTYVTPPMAPMYLASEITIQRDQSANKVIVKYETTKQGYYSTSLSSALPQFPLPLNANCLYQKRSLCEPNKIEYKFQAYWDMTNVVYDFFYLKRSPYNPPTSGGNTLATAPKYVIVPGLANGIETPIIVYPTDMYSSTVSVESNDYQWFKSISNSVYPLYLAADMGADGPVGTAFFIGKENTSNANLTPNLLLTNKHNFGGADGTHASLDFIRSVCSSRAIDISKISSTGTNTSTYANCEEVLACSAPEDSNADWCIFRVGNTSLGQPLSSVSRPLKLSRNGLAVGQNGSGNAFLELSQIGNAFGNGIQGSRGKGYSFSTSPNFGMKFGHNIPQLPGNSGSPILIQTSSHSSNFQDHLVVGLATWRRKDIIELGMSSSIAYGQNIAKILDYIQLNYPDVYQQLNVVP